MTSNSKELIELAERVRLRSVIDENGCAIWQGAKNDRGYGQIWDGERVRYTHRVAFEAAKGHLPPGLQIDHLCRNRICCNPDHLDAVTPRENTRRGYAGLHRRIEAATITHCPQGHPYNEENTYVSKAGKRHCKPCAIERQRQRRRAA